MGKWTRREFLGATAIASAGFAAELARATEPAESSAKAAASVTGVAPAGALAARIALSGRRLTTTGIPMYSDEMLLADVTLDTRRRFYDFSGDTSGRYLEALSALPAPGRSPESLAHLAAQILQNQRPDGRFGSTDLAFTAEQIGNEHMALLWGNGRLLVGLLVYYGATGDANALAAARKVADFLLGVRQAAKTPGVSKRLEGQGAFGFICFTQLTEGLSLLGHATSDRRYFEAAAEILPLLPPRGVQHAHGYLTTLRGALMLYEETRDPALLAYIEKLWGDLAGSSDYIIDGSVLEYFGWGDPANLPLLDSAKAASGTLPRNEGCGLADVVRLTLNLYRVTGNITYLEQAERCYLNAFAHNQFATGDFGSRVWFADGFTPTSSVDRAWWCCTMHGYRAFRDVLDSAVTAKDDVVSVHLFEDLDWHRTADLRIRRTVSGATIEIERAYPGALRVRNPQWSTATSVERNGRRANVGTGSYAEVGRGFAAGEQVKVDFTYATQVISPSGQKGRPDTLVDKPRRAAIYCGPYLMAADEELDDYFFSEPWPGNVISLPGSAAAKADGNGRLRLGVRYQHEGFPGSLETELRPMGEKPANDQRTLAVWLNCKASANA